MIFQDAPKPSPPSGSTHGIEYGHVTFANDFLTIQSQENRGIESVDGAQGFQISSHEIFAIQCDSCEYSHISKKAAAFCQDCAEYFCESCETAHGKLKLTRSHKLLSGALMPPKRSAGL